MTTTPEVHPTDLFIDRLGALGQAHKEGLITTGELLEQSYDYADRYFLAKVNKEQEESLR